MTSPIAKRIEELRQTLSRAVLNYEVWWLFRSSDTRPKYIDTMNRYPAFFLTAIHAHFVALLVALYSLYETRHDSHNIPQLLRRLRTERKLGAATLNELDEMNQRMKPLWAKIGILRNEAFAHRSTSLDIDGVFKKAGLKPNDIRNLLDGTKALMNKITLERDSSVHEFNAGSREDALRILEALKKRVPPNNPVER